MCQAITFNKRLLSDMFIAILGRWYGRFYSEDVSKKMVWRDYNILAASIDVCIYAEEFRTKGIA